MLPAGFLTGDCTVARGASDFVKYLFNPQVITHGTEQSLPALPAVVSVAALISAICRVSSEARATTRFVLTSNYNLLEGSKI